MVETRDVIVIGAGAAGLTAAGGLARLGLDVALVESGPMGGECLNVGCVPSKALLAAARRAQAVRDAGRFGVGAGERRIDVAAVREHVRAAIAAIAPHDSAERFEAWGVEVIRGRARFIGPRLLDIDGRRLRAPRIVLAIGSRPASPPIPGLAATPHLTNETVFDLPDLPSRLLVIGAGAVGLELAQAFRRLGSEVAVLDRGPPLAGDDPEAVAVVVDRLRAEGVAFRCGTAVASVAGRAGAVAATLATGERLDGSHLLVAAGRTVPVEALDLGRAGVDGDAGGIAVDRRRRTTAPGVFAIGDGRRGPRFTHAAGHDGARIVAAIGFGVPASVDLSAFPRVVHTDPDLLQVGPTEAEARAGGGSVTVLRQAFSANDRAVADGEPEGFLKLVRRGRRVVGATAVGAGAGELAPSLVALVGRRRPSLWAFSSAVLPYPTRAEIVSAAAFAAYEPILFSRPARAWARALARLRRVLWRP